MQELSATKTKDEMYQYLRDSWRFQVQQGKKYGRFPQIKPSKIYVALFGALPYSKENKALLKQLDSEFDSKHAEDYQFVFKYKSGTYSVLITNVSNYEEALKKALGALVKKSNLGIPSYPLAKHLMNTGELTMDFTNIQ